MLNAEVDGYCWYWCWCCCSQRLGWRAWWSWAPRRRLSWERATRPSWSARWWLHQCVDLISSSSNIFFYWLSSQWKRWQRAKKGVFNHNVVLKSNSGGPSLPPTLPILVWGPGDLWTSRHLWTGLLTFWLQVSSLFLLIVWVGNIKYLLPGVPWKRRRKPPWDNFATSRLRGRPPGQ